jgi:hypothetical protein
MALHQPVKAAGTRSEQAFVFGFADGHELVDVFDAAI